MAGFLKNGLRALNLKRWILFGPVHADIIDQNFGDVVKHISGGPGISVEEGPVPKRFVISQTSRISGGGGAGETEGEATDPDTCAEVPTAFSGTCNGDGTVTITSTATAQVKRC